MEEFMPMKARTLLGVLVLTSLLTLAACQAKTVVVEKEVTRIVIEEKVVPETVIVEKEITKIVVQRETVQVEITATPTALPQGGTLHLTSLADVETLNPLLSDDGPSTEIQSYLYDAPFRSDPWTGETLPHMVESWELDDGNRTVVYHVRQGMQWSDGEPITALDFKFTFDALLAADGQGQPVLSQSPHLDLVEQVETVELIDDYTLQVRYSEPLCANVARMDLRWLPSHVYLADPDFRFADLVEHSSNWEPTVFSGPFVLQGWVADDHITLARNEGYWQGAPHLDGIEWQVMFEEAEALERLRSGASDLGIVPPQGLAEMEEVQDLNLYKLFSQSNYVYLGLNQGDPENPQPRLNEDGSVNPEHGQHPILSKKEVRQALAYATDRNTIVMRVVDGQGTPLPSLIPPSYAWAYDEQLEPRDYHPDKAAEVLDAAGWVLNEETGVRECQGCETAEDGTPMMLNLKTVAGNTTFENVIQLVQQQWGEIGVDVEIQYVEWVAFRDLMLAQNFDVLCIAWNNVSPDNEALFFGQYDVPGHGFNYCSFYQPDYEPLETEAKTLEGCSYEERGEIYRQIQEILHEEQPYIWLYAPRTILAVNRRVQNVNPGPWSTAYNIHEWYIQADQDSPRE
jgi:peptide/nickel transport system substrate-binding protein